jgi:hypothetical protein
LKLPGDKPNNSTATRKIRKEIEGGHECSEFKACQTFHMVNIQREGLYGKIGRMMHSSLKSAKGLGGNKLPVS